MLQQENKTNKGRPSCAMPHSDFILLININMGSHKLLHGFNVFILLSLPTIPIGGCLDQIEQEQNIPLQMCIGFHCIGKQQFHANSLLGQLHIDCCSRNNNCELAVFATLISCTQNYFINKDVVEGRNSSPFFPETSCVFINQVYLFLLSNFIKI